jgi:hypothetical protein
VTHTSPLLAVNTYSRSVQFSVVPLAVVLAAVVVELVEEISVAVDEASLMVESEADPLA